LFIHLCVSLYCRTLPLTSEPTPRPAPPAAQGSVPPTRLLALRFVRGLVRLHPPPRPRQQNQPRVRFSRHEPPPEAARRPRRPQRATRPAARSTAAAAAAHRGVPGALRRRRVAHPCAPSFLSLVCVLTPSRLYHLFSFSRPPSSTPLGHCDVTDGILGQSVQVRPRGRALRSGSSRFLSFSIHLPGSTTRQHLTAAPAREVLHLHCCDFSTRSLV